MNQNTGDLEPPIGRTRRRRSRARRSREGYWPSVSALLAILYVSSHDSPLWLRVSCLVIVASVPWTAYKFVETLIDRPGHGVDDVEGRSRAGNDAALALPGLQGCLLSVAAMVGLSMIGHSNAREAVGVVWVMLGVPLTGASVVGLVAASNRARRFRALGVCVNAIYLLWITTFMVILWSRW